MDEANISVIRVGITHYPGYVEQCAINATTPQNIPAVCDKKLPGLSMLALQILQLAMGDTFRFVFVKLDDNVASNSVDQYIHAFEENQIDMSGMLFRHTYKRSRLVQYSSPIIFSHNAFLINARQTNIRTKNTFIGLTNVSGTVIVLWTLFTVVVALTIVLIHKHSNAEIVQKRPLWYWTIDAMYRLVISLIDTNDFVKNSRGKKIWKIAFIQTTWIFSLAAFMTIFATFLRVDMLNYTYQPFRNPDQLFHLVGKKQLRIIDHDPIHPLLLNEYLSDATSYSVYSQALANNPAVFVAANMSAVKHKIITESDTVLFLPDILAKHYQAKNPNLTFIIDNYSLETWQGFIFPHNSSLSTELTNASLYIQASLTRALREYSRSYDTSNRRASHKDNLRHALPVSFFATTSFVLTCSYILSIMIFALELCKITELINSTLQLGVTAANTSVVRVGGLSFPGYIDPCVFLVKHMQQMPTVCKGRNPGVAAIALHLLQIAVASKYRFEIIQLNVTSNDSFWTAVQAIDDGVIDLSLDLMIHNLYRTQFVTFSDAVISPARVFIVHRYLSDISYMEHFAGLTRFVDKSVLLCLLVLSLIIVILAVCILWSGDKTLSKNLIFNMPTLQPSDTLQLLDRLSWIKTPLKKMSLLIVLLVWTVMFSTFLRCYNAVVQTNFMPYTRLPFERWTDLLGYVEKNELQLIGLALHNSPVVMALDDPSITDETFYMQLQQYLNSTPLLTVNSTELVTIMDSSSKYVLETDNYVASTLLAKSDRLKKIDDMYTIQSWHGYIMARNNTQLRDDLKIPIQMIQSSLSKEINYYTKAFETAGSATAKSQNRDSVKILRLDFFSELFLAMFVAHALSCLVVLLERHYESMTDRRSLIPSNYGRMKKQRNERLQSTVNGLSHVLLLDRV